MSRNITVGAGNSVLVLFNGFYGTLGGGRHVVWCIFRGTTNIKTVADSVASGSPEDIMMMAVDAAPPTGANTYNIRFGVNLGGQTVRPNTDNGVNARYGNPGSHLVLVEFTP